MGAQIATNRGTNWFEFSQSRTGQLDFSGRDSFSVTRCLTAERGLISH